MKKTKIFLLTPLLLFSLAFGLSLSLTAASGTEDYAKGNFTFTKFEDYMISPSNKQYEDNADFCRERVSAALESCKYLAVHIGESGGTFSPDIINEYTNVSLIHYSRYLSSVQ